MKTVILLFCSILWSYLATGQELYGKFLDGRQGLLSQECYDINFNKEGYLIVGTQYGPMKYDGEKFISICLNLPIEERIIYDFEKDSQGRIYLMNSKNELFLLKKDRAIRLNPKKTASLPVHLRFKKLHWTSKGLFILTNDIYYRYSIRHNTLSPCSKHTNKNYNYLVFNSKKEFPFEKHRSELNNLPKHRILFPALQKNIRCKDPLGSESREDFIRIGKTGFALINNNLYRITSSEVKALPYNNVLFIEFFHKRLWVATHRGLLELDKNGKLIQTHFFGELIGGMAPLPNQGIAVSLNQGGVFICSNIHERCHKNVLPSEIAHNGESIIIGTKRGELFLFKNNKLLKVWNPVKLDNGDTTASMTNLRRIEFIRNKWYVCSIKGIYSLSRDFRKREVVRYSMRYSFNDFFFSNNDIYAVSWSDICSSDLSRKRINIPLIRCRSQLNDSVVLLGGERGLFEFYPKAYRFVRSSLFRDSCYISHIQKLSPDEFLISSRYKGIFHFRNGHLIKRHPSPFISLKKAVISKGRLYAAGNQGIYVKPVNSAEKTPWTNIFSKEVRNMFLINQKLFICTDHDLITKELNYKAEVSSPVILNEVRLGSNKLHHVPGKIEYHQPISLDFDILAFSANKLGLYYQLNGASENFRYKEGTTISFEALPGGSYHLKVFPVIDGKIQFANPKNYHFEIPQPFWETTLFYFLISVVVLLILLSIRLIWNLRRKKRIAARAELESKLNEYKLLAVKAQVNPHFLSNGLAAIQALILKEDNELAAHYLAKFSYLMRKTLYYSEQQFISVSDELQLVDSYLELEQLRFRNRFEIRRSIRLTEHELKNTLIPSLLLQPILENAIWHGLKFQENNPVLSITFEKDTSGRLLIVIRDNGPGFQNHNKNEKHLSKGNQLITERIDTLNQQFGTLVACIRIQSSEEGTSVTFVFDPKLTNHESIYHR